MAVDADSARLVRFNGGEAVIAAEDAYPDLTKNQIVQLAPKLSLTVSELERSEVLERTRERIEVKKYASGNMGLALVMGAAVFLLAKLSLNAGRWAILATGAILAGSLIGANCRPSETAELDAVRYDTTRLRKLIATGDDLAISMDVERVLSSLLPLGEEPVNMSQESTGRSRLRVAQQIPFRVILP